MSGVNHSIATKRLFDFSSLGMTLTSEVVLTRAFDVTDAKALDLVVRVHSATVGSGASIQVRAYAVSLTAEEPQTDFLNSSPIATATIDNALTSSLPALLVQSASLPFGHMVRITVRGAQSSTFLATVRAEISVDLVARDQ